jgi:hydrogenase maturation factor
MSGVDPIGGRRTFRPGAKADALHTHMVAANDAAVAGAEPYWLLMHVIRAIGPRLSDATQHRIARETVASIEEEK